MFQRHVVILISAILCCCLHIKLHILSCEMFVWPNEAFQAHAHLCVWRKRFLSINRDKKVGEGGNDEIVFG